MAKRLDYIDDLLRGYYDETLEGLVDRAPSRLTRGQGTEKNFYIMKVDLVGSTMMFRGKHKATYLKLAHTFLSTVDRITQEYGADPEQTEYAGDSVIAYFPESTPAENVMYAACYSRAAVLRLPALGGAMSNLNPRCRIVLHYAPLIVAKIGPRAGSILTAIGHPIHLVAKIEKEINSDIGRATKEFYNQISRENKRLFTEVYTERTVEIPATVNQPYVPVLSQESRPNAIANALYGNPNPPPRLERQFRTEKTIIGYDLRWGLLNKVTGLTS